MTTPKQSWQRVTELFEQALEHPSDERAPFLKSACAGDDVLLREVESLLAQHDADTGFLESPAVAAVASAVAYFKYFRSSSPAINSIAILPFVNEKGSEDVYRQGHSQARALPGE